MTVSLGSDGKFDPKAARARWRADPAAFVDDGAVRDPETAEKFELNWSQRQFLAHAFKTGADGRLMHPELLYSAPKKSGKTAFAAMVALYVVTILGGRHAEAVIVANDLEQSVNRVFAAIRRMVELMGWLRKAANITERRITFPETGASITAIASDYAGAAGSNANIAVFDELWGYTSERSRRLWDEMIPPPTRKIACRLTTTYAGFEGESVLLEELHKRGHAQPLVGKDLHAGDGLLMAWHNEPVAPWQTPAWIEQMRAQMRPNAFLRMIENRFVSGESTFVDLAWWDACVDAGATQVFMDKSLPVWVGVDASVKRDSTAIVAVTWDKHLNKVRLVGHRVFQPTSAQPLDFDNTIVPVIDDIRRRFSLRGVHYDPYQMARWRSGCRRPACRCGSTRRRRRTSPKWGRTCTS
jgi:phage terminase large subunit-like protein